MQHDWEPLAALYFKLYPHELIRHEDKVIKLFVIAACYKSLIVLFTFIWLFKEVILGRVYQAFVTNTLSKDALFEN